MTAIRNFKKIGKHVGSWHEVAGGQPDVISTQGALFVWVQKACKTRHSARMASESASSEHYRHMEVTCTATLNTP